MNYSRFSSLGYVTRDDSSFSHPYRIVNPVMQHPSRPPRENYSGLRVPIESSNVINYSGSGDQASFLNFLRDHPVAFIWFHAVWCGHCIAMKEAYSSAADQLSESVSFIKIDADKYPQLCQLYSVDSYPTLKLFKNGQVAADFVGKRTVENFVSWLQSNMG